jgi:hypothetical protein
MGFDASERFAGRQNEWRGRHDGRRITQHSGLIEVEVIREAIVDEDLE